VFELQRLGPDHELAVLEFEQANRAYFVEFINDRGDEFFAEFAERYRESLAEQERGDCAFYVLVDDGGHVVGRFNLYDILEGTAVVGYRLARRVAGRGVATFALRELCRIAREQHRLRTLTAGTSNENVASQKVLTKAGFVAAGPAEVGGRPGTSYRLDLTARPDISGA
jgi:ribosomal-protein-alanine N-acetyltransferase